jgi:hypothetical protein
MWKTTSIFKLKILLKLSNILGEHHLVARITSINRQGDAANVGLEIEYETFTFVDYMHLLKINNEWLIVSKTYTTIPKDF